MLVGAAMDVPTFAVSAAEKVSMEYCKHHTEHTAECGYTEETPCTFECAECTSNTHEDAYSVSENEVFADTFNVSDNTITAWSWIDEKECIDFETNTVVLSGAGVENIVLKSDIINLLPASITATVNETEEIVTLSGWECEAYPEAGAYEGTYTFIVNLPEGYTLGEGVKGLSVNVELGGAELYETLDAEENGFLATDYMEWNDGVPSVSEEAVYSGNDLGASFAGTTISFAYRESEESELLYVAWDDIGITMDEEDAKSLVSCSAYDNMAGLYDIRFDACGDYVFSYKNDSINVHVDYPQVGFYSSENYSIDTYLYEFNFHNMENNVFYVVLDAPEGYTTTLANDNPFSVFSYEEEKEVSAEQLEEYISTEEAGVGIYKITVNTEAGFDLNVNAVCTNNEDTNDSWTTSMGMAVWYSEVMEGLVIKDWIDFDPETNSLVVSEKAEFCKNTGTSLNGTTLYFAYLENEEDNTPETVSLENLSVTLDGNDAMQYVSMSVNESNADLIDLRFEKTGDYTVSYQGSKIVINVGYPVLGFYKTPELSNEGYIKELYEYTTGKNDVIYFIVNSGDANISEINVGHKYYDGCISTEMISDTDGIIIYKISILDKLDSKFIVYGTCQCAYGEDEPYEEYHEISVKSTGLSGRKAYTDGEKHLGYTGCYMTEAEYNAGTIFWDNNTPMFWVHADTVQGVIDKLSAVANGDEILYKKVDFAGPDTGDGTDGMEITNTGYIYVTISQIGNINLQDQYVSSSGNMKGIYFTSGKDHAYSDHGYENGFYIEDCVFNLDSVKARITAAGDNVDAVIPQDLQGKSYVSRYKGKAYHVTKVTNGEQHYFTLGNEVTFASGEENKETLLLQYLDLNNIEGIAEMTPFFKYPEMHVNIYCDMKFTGRYEKLSIGFKEGKNYNATITNLLTGESEDVYTIDDLGGAKTKEVSTTFVYDDEGGAIVNENTSVWLYEIDSETVTSGNYDGEVKITETPEPNAMPELTQEQKDAIENGKKLTVDVQTDEEEPKNIDSRIDAKVKEVINDSSYSGIMYLDLSVSASVEGVENNGQKIQTSVTEIKAPMEITMDIPKHAVKHGRKYKLIRHHVGKDGREYTELIEGKLSDDGRKMTFKTDKYSTYAIAYDSVDTDNTTSGGGSTDNNTSSGDSTDHNTSSGSSTNHNNSSSGNTQMKPIVEAKAPIEPTVEKPKTVISPSKQASNTKEESVEDVTVKVECKEESTVLDNVTEVTPVIDMKLQLAVKEEVMWIIDAIHNNSLGKDVLDEETLANVKEALENDESIVTEILVEKLDESAIDMEIKKAFEDALTAAAEDKEGATAKVLQFLDSSLLLKAEDGQVLGTINKLSKNVTFTLAIPDELKQGEKEFVVLRMHDNEVTALETTRNADDTVSFVTDKFSIYALAYMEEPVEEIEEESEAADIGTADIMEISPKSDTNIALLVILVFVAAGIGLFAFYLYKKNQKKEK